MTNVIVKVGDSFMEGELGDFLDDGERIVVQGEDWTWIGSSAHVMPAEEEPDDNCMVRTWSQVNGPEQGVMMWEASDKGWSTLPGSYRSYELPWQLLRRFPHRVYRPTDGEF